MYEFSEGMIVNITRVWDVKLNAHDVIMICGRGDYVRYDTCGMWDMKCGSWDKRGCVYDDVVVKGKVGRVNVCIWHADGIKLNFGL